MIRYQVEIHPQNGDSWVYLYVDCDIPLVPREGDYVELYDSLTTTVQSVAFCPTQDPAVYVNCRSIKAETGEEAEKIAAEAVSIEGWKRR